MKLNFLPEEAHIKHQENKSLGIENPVIQPSFNLTKLIIILAVAFLIIFAGLAGILAFSKNQIFADLSKLNFLSQVGQLITSQDKKLIGEEQDRVNVLLLGIGGEGHEGGKLTDTIILASYKPSEEKFAMMSIPRDLYIKSENFGWTKINAVYAYAEQKKEGDGPRAISEALENLFDQQINYHVVVDFEGFEKLIDDLGGIDVMVDNDLIDNSYPAKGRENAYPYSSRFERLVIKKGPQQFDGETALKFARSRHGAGSEGSDFARSRRQQKIIMAVKDKALSSLINPGKVSSMISAYNKNIKTNLQLWEILRIYNLTKNIDRETIINQQLDDSPQGLLYSQMLNGAYVLLPRGSNYSKIRAIWQNIFTSTSTDFIVKQTDEDANLARELEKINQESKKNESFTVISSTKATTTVDTDDNNQIINDISNNENDNVSSTLPPYQGEKASIEIRNGTEINGWASTEKTKLLTQKFNITQVGNAPTKDYGKVYVYNITGQNPATALELSKIYNVSILTETPPFPSKASFLIILGK